MKARTDTGQQIDLLCDRCSLRFAAAPMRLDCPHCGDSPVGLADDALPETILASACASSAGIWSFAAGLPAVPERHRVSLGEGHTPLLPLRAPRAVDVHVKVEAHNPTQSYKDRFNAINVSIARAWGRPGVALISTGNAGLAAAAYGAAAGLSVRVFGSPDMPALIRRAIDDYGAEVRLGAPSEQRRGLEAAIGEGFLPGSRSVPFSSVTPFGAEGYTTIAYEIVAELGDAPRYVAVPVGGGDGIYGIGRGFRRLQLAGLVSRMPILIGARSRGAIAPSISGDEIGSHAHAAVSRSGGHFLDVGDSAIRDAVRLLGRQGIAAEPASATAVAAALDLGLSRTVCVVTGGGYKWQELT